MEKVPRPPCCRVAGWDQSQQAGGHWSECSREGCIVEREGVRWREAAVGRAAAAKRGDGTVWSQRRCHCAAWEADRGATIRVLTIANIDVGFIEFLDIFICKNPPKFNVLNI